MKTLIVSSVASSFVYHKMKIISDKGSGEGKLFIGSISKETEFDSFFEFETDIKYKLDKQNLLDYMHEVKLEYVYQFFNQYQEANIQNWDDYYEKIKNLTENELLLNLVKQTDSARYYIDQEKFNESDKLTFKTFVRKIIVPKLTNIIFEKDIKNQIITLKLVVNYNFSKQNEEQKVVNLSQIIYYGVPGSGKSHIIDKITEKLPDDQKMRVVFHPEYTNADFVGQILPIQDSGGIDYQFKAGPFSRILKRALKNPNKPYYLIIEEINRGNAAAIFGDLFQLLDRDNNGWSSYSIENLDINAFIRSEDERYSEKNPPSTKKVGDIEFTENTSLHLPPNLSLLATMNTSDQNVFTLDNAFQRRWDMQLVKNECSDTNQMDAIITVANQKITWGDFQQTINAVIGEKSNEGGLSSMEDKRLGCWFVKAENGEISKETFANKVLKYLWDDAFKFYHQEIFGSEIKNFEELQTKFNNIGFNVFSESCGLRNVVSTSSTTEAADSKAAPTQTEPEHQ